MTSLASIVRAVLAAIAAIALLTTGDGMGVPAAHASSAYGYDAPANVVAVAHAAMVGGTASTTPTPNTRAVAVRGERANANGSGWSTSAIATEPAAKGEGALSRLGRRLADERGEFDPSAFRRPRPGSGKGRASDVPSWVGSHPDGRPLVGESGKDFAKRLLDKQYGEGNWSGTGPGSEYNQIKKYGDRGFE